MDKQDWLTKVNHLNQLLTNARQEHTKSVEQLEQQLQAVQEQYEMEKEEWMTKVNHLNQMLVNTQQEHAKAVEQFEQPIQEKSKTDWNSSSHRTPHSTGSCSPKPRDTPSHAMRQTRSDLPNFFFERYSNIHHEEKSKERPAELDVAGMDQSWIDETSTSQLSTDVRSPLESMDKTAKDYDKLFTPESPERDPKTHQGGRMRFDAVFEDAHSAQASCTLSSSWLEREIVPNSAFNEKSITLFQINSDIGIPKGDILISLLSENVDTPWATRFEEAIWRCHTMRQQSDTKWLRQKLERQPNTPSHGRTSVLVDVDDMRVVGGIESIVSSQRSALEHLKYDDFDDALALYVLCKVD
jgi:hypothetical protein